MKKKYQGKTFKEFHESVAEEFEMECLKGCALRFYFWIKETILRNVPIQALHHSLNHLKHCLELIEVAGADQKDLIEESQK